MNIIDYTHREWYGFLINVRRSVGSIIQYRFQVKSFSLLLNQAYYNYCNNIIAYEKNFDESSCTLYHCPRTPVSITRGGSNIFIHVFAVNIYACIHIRIVHNVRARKFRMNKTNGFLSLSPSVRPYSCSRYSRF